jgi:hypothetical protein
MKDSVSFQNSLAEALERQHQWLDKTEMVRLKEEFRIFQASFIGLYQVLLKKGVIHEDPYKNDVKIGELSIPPEGPFSESERLEQMSVRLSNFESQLDFLVNFYQFSVDFFTLERIKRVVALVKYFAWTQFSANSQYINTRALVEIINMVKGGNDQLSLGLLTDSLQHLERSSKEIFKILKEISDYHRENYKLEIRIRFLDNLTFDPATVITHKDDTLLQIKRKFAECMSDRPFYPELVEEVLREDYSGEGNNLRIDLLKKLEVPDIKPKNKKEQISYKNMLLDGMRGLSSVVFALNDGIRKMDENSAILESEKNKFWDKVKRLLRQVFNQQAETIFYEIEYFDTVLGTSKTENLNYLQFKGEVERQARYLSSLSNRNSNLAKKIESASDDQILSMLSKNIEELQGIHKTLSALDVFFKSETAKEDRDKIRGIKPELSTIKNAIVKANQKRHEYIAQKEEMEQMKRLGISDES